MEENENVNEYLAMVPLGGRSTRSSGDGCLITFDWLNKELQKMLAISLNEEIGQVNITKEGFVLFINKKGEQ